jgi:predicted transcriptional regulator
MQNICFNVLEEKKHLIDEIAALQEKDRSDVINEALDSYLEVMDWQFAHIEEGVRQAEAGEFATNQEVKAAFDLWKTRC